MSPLDVLSDAIRAERASLARLARKEGLGAADAVDVVQDAFCTYLRAAQRGELPPADATRAWLATAVKNAARNKRRRHHVARPHDALDALPAAEDATVETLVARAEEHVRLRACVEQLCETQRAVVTLRLLEERAGEDVAATLGLTRGHVDVLLHRAKHALRVCMTE
ncbi:MAG TPA: sigma-70 family RNA polymerase sigma factor [Labilithrix sp.]|jgi:RNA polymerase sigma-70 factor (ECF subfamily)